VLTTNKKILKVVSNQSKNNQISMASTSKKLTLSSLQNEILDIRKQLQNQKPASMESPQVVNVADTDEFKELKNIVSIQQDLISKLIVRVDALNTSGANNNANLVLQRQIDDLKKRVAVSNSQQSGTAEGQPSILIVDEKSQAFVPPLDGRLTFNTDTSSLEIFFQGSWYSVSAQKK
jgi:hypothetical protein